MFEQFEKDILKKYLSTELDMQVANFKRQQTDAGAKRAIEARMEKLETILEKLGG